MKITIENIPFDIKSINISSSHNYPLGRLGHHFNAAMTRYDIEFYITTSIIHQQLVRDWMDKFINRAGLVSFQKNDIDIKNLHFYGCIPKNFKYNINDIEIEMMADYFTGDISVISNVRLQYERKEKLKTLNQIEK